jgi:hypothetical protein
MAGTAAYWGSPASATNRVGGSDPARTVNLPALRMFPSVAMRQFMPGHAGIIDADDEASPGRDNTVRAATNNLARRHFSADRPRPSIPGSDTGVLADFVKEN